LCHLKPKLTGLLWESKRRSEELEGVGERGLLKEQNKGISELISSVQKETQSKEEA